MYVQITYQIKCCGFCAFLLGVNPGIQPLRPIQTVLCQLSPDGTGGPGPKGPKGGGLTCVTSSTHWCLTIQKGLPVTIKTLR